MELNELINSMATEGDIDSRGVFTLDTKYSQRKLDEYSLVDPSLFILNLIAAAVLSQAQKFVIDMNRTETYIFFDGLLPAAEHLSELSDYILHPAPHPALRELAVALHAACGLPHNPKIELAVGANKVGWQARVDQQPWHFVSGRAEEQGVKLKLHHSANIFLTLFAGSGVINSGQKILDQLLHFCRYAPLELTVNGKIRADHLSVNALNNQGLFAIRLLKGEQRLMFNPSQSINTDVLVSTGHTSPVASSMLLGLAQPYSAENMGLLLVSRGVIFKRSAKLLGWPIACAVITADHLDKNLSQTNLVEDEQFNLLVTAAKHQLELLLEEVCLNPTACSPEVVQVLIDFLKERYPQAEYPFAADIFMRFQALSANLANISKAEAEVEYYLSLSLVQQQTALALREEMLRVFTTRIIYLMDIEEWGSTESFLDQYQRLSGEKLTELCMLVCFFNQQLSQARAIDKADSTPPSVIREILRYLWGWTDTLAGETKVHRFFKFERALEMSQMELAQKLADGLAQGESTSFLNLWLGWFALSRDDYNLAQALWSKALEQVNSRLYSQWHKCMWSKLAGKVSLPIQVRWQVNYARHCYDDWAKPKHKLKEILESQAENSLFSWSQRIWSLRREKDPTSKQRFLNYLLINLLPPRGGTNLNLVSFTQSDLPTSLPTA